MDLPANYVQQTPLVRGDFSSQTVNVHLAMPYKIANAMVKSLLAV